MAYPSSSSSGKCPVCGEPVVRAEGSRPADYPFCSPRCRDVDLYRWFNEGYSVPVETNRVVQQSLEERQPPADEFYDGDTAHLN